MTDDNKRANLKDEWLLSDEAWRDGEALRAAGSIRGAISRYYYAAFYAARAALITRDVEAKSHNGTRTEFLRLFVHAGTFPRETARVLTVLQKGREDADYDRTIEIRHDDVDEAMSAAREFREAVAGLLRSDGWMS